MRVPGRHRHGIHDLGAHYAGMDPAGPSGQGGARQRVSQLRSLPLRATRTDLHRGAEPGAGDLQRDAAPTGDKPPITPTVMTPRLRRAVFGPVLVTGALAVAAAPVTGPVMGGGWLLAWLLLGLTAGYVLSGSA